MLMVARRLTAVVDVGGDVHSRVVVIRQAPEQWVLLEVGPYPVLPALRLVCVQLECWKRKKTTMKKERKNLIVFLIRRSICVCFARIYVSRRDPKALPATSSGEACTSCHLLAPPTRGGAIVSLRLADL